MNIGRIIIVDIAIETTAEAEAAAAAAASHTSRIYILRTSVCQSNIAAYNE